ncbi:MAG: hypothetical protein WCC97_18675 [Candidatus Acidiferrales bacterium]
MKTKTNPHSQSCRICRHPQREQIEAAFLDWIPMVQIAKDFKLTDRQVVRRHARAMHLFKKRDANVRSALSAFIERGARLRPNPASFVAACTALSKLDAEGRTVEVVEKRNSPEGAFWEQMTNAEALAYAERNEIPDWMKQQVHDTQLRAPRKSNE